MNMFPYIGSNTSQNDITISSNTTWDASNYPFGYCKCRTLTIAAGVTLKINKSPFVIVCQNLVFGSTTSIIDSSGLSGSGIAWPTNVDQAKGGYTTCAQGGCGGGMLFIIADNVIGAMGQIKSNGGNGYAVSGSGSGIAAGSGALSSTIGGFTTSENFDYFIGVSADLNTAAQSTFNVNRTTNLLVAGANAPSAIGGNGGGTGQVNTNTYYSAGGGSGIAGGGSAIDSGNVSSSYSANPLTSYQLVLLSSIGCRGGGGGAAAYISSFSSAGGGGGGSIALWSYTNTANPSLTANGGNASFTQTGTDASVGGSGLCYKIQI
jgi:hypothetical protein